MSDYLTPEYFLPIGKFRNNAPNTFLELIFRKILTDRVFPASF